MAILSKRTLAEVIRSYRREYGLELFLMDLSGRTDSASDSLAILSNTRKRRNYALQEGVNLGEPYIFDVGPSVLTWIVALEDRRLVHGGLVGGEVVVEERRLSYGDDVDYLVSHGMARRAAIAFMNRLPVWPQSRVTEASGFLQETFYKVSGWKPDLMNENRLKNLQHKQINIANPNRSTKGRQRWARDSQSHTNSGQGIPRARAWGRGCRLREASLHLS